MTTSLTTSQLLFFVIPIALYFFGLVLQYKFLLLAGSVGIALQALAYFNTFPLFLSMILLGIALIGIYYSITQQPKTRQYRAHAIILVICLVTILGIKPVSAATSTTTYVHQNLDPYYRSGLTNGVNTTYNLTIQSPDNIGTIKSAILGFDAWITPTVTFQAWVNGGFCRNQNYTISTTFATTSQAHVTFDCTNRITKNGNYTITLKSIGANTGALTGTLDLSYSTDPIGGIVVEGTEYRAGDNGTIFLQVVDSQGLAETNATCFLDVYSPNTPNTTHAQLLTNAPMLYVPNSDGIYYYDYVIPNTTGVYMLAATCAYDTQEVFVYNKQDDTTFPNRTVNTGTFTGGTVFLNDYADWIYNECSSVGGTCNATYVFNLSIHLDNTTLNNITGLQLFYMGESSRTNILQFFVRNTTNGAWIPLSNNLTMSGSAATVPVGIGDFGSNTIPLNNTIATNNTVTVMLYTNTIGNVNMFDNWLSMRAITSVGTIHELRGNSELHVNNWFSKIEDPTFIGNSVWNSSNRTLTQNLTAIFNGTVVFNGTVNFTGNVTFNGSVLFNGTINNSVNVTVNLTVNTTNLTVNSSDIARTVWNYTPDRNLTFYQNVTCIVNVTNVTINITTQNVTVQNVTVNVTTQNVTVQNVTINVTNQTVVVQNVTVNLTNQTVFVQNVTVNVTTEEVNVNTQVVNVTNVTVITQNVTVQNVSFNTTNFVEQVWNYTNQSEIFSTYDFLRFAANNTVNLNISVNESLAAFCGNISNNLSFITGAVTNITNNGVQANFSFRIETILFAIMVLLFVFVAITGWPIMGYVAGLYTMGYGAYYLILSEYFLGFLLVFIGILTFIISIRRNKK